MATTMTKTETKTLIKKQRKRLKEIEQLERLNRSLTPDEKVKVRSKRKVRKFLQSLLSEHVKENAVTGESEENKDEYEFDPRPHVVEHGNEGRLLREKTDERSTTREEKASSSTIRQENEPKQKQELRDDKVKDETKAGKPFDVKVKAAPSLAVSGDGTNRQGKEEPRQPPKDKDESKSGKGQPVITKASPNTKVSPSQPASGDGAAREAKKKKPPRPSLSSKQFKVTNLEGHSDLITAVVLHGDTLVTASRDTTVKTWDVLTGDQKKNFGGHMNSVSCLIVLDVADAQKSVPDLMQTEEPLVISGSFDCSLKVWTLNSGHLLKSIYTYNPVSQIAFASEFSLIVLGSDTGKLELWDLDRGEQQYSIHAYDASVTGIKVADKQLHSSASDGTIKIYSITEDRHLSCVFESENVLSSSGGHLTTRHVRSLELCKKGTLIGDDARNIKVLNWKKNEASKIPNHHSDFSSTDAIRCHGDYIVASSYDLDSGLGYVNVRSSHTMEYQATFDDKDTERILCLDTNLLPSGNMVIATGGVDLKVWEVLKQNADGNDEDVFNAEYRLVLAEAAVDSEDDDDDDDDDDDGDDDSLNEGASRSGTRKLEFQQEAETSWMSWCTLI